MRISTFSGWRELKDTKFTIKVTFSPVQLSKIVEAGSALSDPFAADLMCHFPCRRDYISNSSFDPNEATYLQNVTFSEMKQMFFKKIDQIIFVEHEIQSLHSLLHEYRQISIE